MLTKERDTHPLAQPVFIEPIQVVPVRELPDGVQWTWTYEAKLNGYRCLAVKRSTAVVALVRGEATVSQLDSRYCPRASTTPRQRGNSLLARVRGSRTHGCMNHY